MASHHFIGNGRAADALARSAATPDKLTNLVAAMVESAGLEVVGRQMVGFDNGGLTLVWVLAESHLVLHYWGAEGFATLDLHVCDYGESNHRKASALVEMLTDYCFEPGTASWHELHLDEPVAAALAVE